MVQLSSAIVLAAAALAPLSSALGINCRGSAVCNKVGALSRFAGLAGQLDPNRQYQNGEQIMCLRGAAGTGFCLFLQGTGFGVPGRSIGPLINALIQHKCDTCGSVPIFFPQGNNDPSSGILTSNFVDEARCSGVSAGQAGIC